LTEKQSSAPAQTANTIERMTAKGEVEVSLGIEGTDGEPKTWMMRVPDLSTALAMQTELKRLGISVHIHEDEPGELP
jgi:hypothetical protein